MEERIVDKDEGRQIKLKRTATGEQDAVEEGVETPEEENEVVIDLPELPDAEEYDEDLVGLTPTQLQKALEERRRAEEEALAECEKHLTEARAALSEKDYKKAEAYFVQALVYVPDSREAKEGLWVTRTKGFTDTEVLFEKKTVNALKELEEEDRLFLYEKLSAPLKELREQYTAEAAPLTQKVEEAQAERREAFRANRKYYRRCFFIVFAVFAVLAIAAGVSASFIVRTRSDLPIILSSVFGGLSLIALIITLIYTRKLFVASRLCTVNEKLSSTEDGARLAYLNGRISVLNLILEAPEEA